MRTGLHDTRAEPGCGAHQAVLDATGAACSVHASAQPSAQHAMQHAGNGCPVAAGVRQLL